MAVVIESTFNFRFSLVYYFDGCCQLRTACYGFLCVLLYADHSRFYRGTDGIGSVFVNLEGHCEHVELYLQFFPLLDTMLLRLRVKTVSIVM